MTRQLTNHQLAEGFVRAWNANDILALGALFHPDFTWHIAVTGYDEPQLRPLQSQLLKGKNLPWKKSIYNKAETLEIFGGILGAVREFRVELTSVISDGDKMALELLGTAFNETKGRRYDNIYCYVFHLREGKIVLFREYQDTLLLFDAWVAD
jgi:ketosteroid isomerase-like protein